MKKMNVKTLLASYPLVILVIAFFMTGCRSPKEFVYRDFKNFKVDNVGFSSTKVKVDIVYYNPNNFGLQLKSTDLDVFIEGNYLGHTAQEYQISIPKLKDFTIPLSIDVDMKNAFKNGFTTLFNKEVTVKVTGKVKVGKANIFKSFPVNYEGKHTFSL
jgi:LEA14-like dessication related protein